MKIWSKKCIKTLIKKGKKPFGERQSLGRERKAPTKVPIVVLNFDLLENLLEIRSI